MRILLLHPYRHYLCHTLDGTTDYLDNMYKGGFENRKNASVSNCALVWNKYGGFE